MIDQSDDDVCQVNDSKTKEMIFGSDVTIVAMPPLVSLNSEQVEIADRFKLLIALQSNEI